MAPSIHILIGQKFYRLVEQVKQYVIGTSMELSLPMSPEDFHDIFRTPWMTFSEK